MFFKSWTPRRIGVAVFGGVLVLFGLVAVPLPIVPGWAVVIAGLVVLSREFHWAHRLVVRGRRILEQRRRPTSSDDQNDSGDLRLSA